jgi:hypothetical protein
MQTKQEATNIKFSQAWWLTPIISAAWEEEIRRIEV